MKDFYCSNTCNFSMHYVCLDKVPAFPHLTPRSSEFKVGRQLNLTDKIPP